MIIDSILHIDYMMSAFYNTDLNYPESAAILHSPMMYSNHPSCLSFNYLLQSNMRVSIANSSSSLTLAHYTSDGGPVPHIEYIDLPVWQYYIIWEVISGSHGNLQSISEGSELFSGAVYDIQAVNSPCHEIRRSPTH